MAGINLPVFTYAFVRGVPTDHLELPLQPFSEPLNALAVGGSSETH